MTPSGLGSLACDAVSSSSSVAATSVGGGKTRRRFAVELTLAEPSIVLEARDPLTAVATELT